MRYESKLWHREGSYLTNSQTSFDLSNIRYLHTGVDTVKQLFKCLLKTEILVELQRIYDSGFNQVIELGGIDWLISRSSKSAGYQWILRNGDEGLVVLLKSFYADESLHASHVKIEVSPQLIARNTPKELSDYLKKIASSFATQLNETGIAAHIAVDIKGFEIPEDFEYRLVTKSKRQMRHLGISDSHFSVSETAVVYGDRQTFTFGSVGGLQMQLYDKVTEAIKTDKIGYWEEKWRQTPSTDDFMEPEYQDGDSVKRLEMRFHHSIIQQFCNGTKDDNGEFIQINNFEDLAKHLTALWRYALNNFRLQHSTSYIDPMWQLLMEDVEIYAPAPDFLYTRKPKPPGESTRRNVGLWLGNHLKLMCRRRFTLDFAVSNILQCGLEVELMDYFGLWGYEGREALPAVVREFIREKFQILELRGVAV